MGDPVRELTHDHADINRRVRAIGTMIDELERGTRTADAALARLIGELRELLFHHFAREEEGLFPFVADVVPELGARVAEMEVAHDTICGALARMYELASHEPTAAPLVAVYRRFERAYAEHARVEGAVLHTLDGRLDEAQRARLAAVVDGL